MTATPDHPPRDTSPRATAKHAAPEPPVANGTTPDNATSGRTTPGHPAPDPATSGQAAPDDAIPDQAASDNAAPNEPPSDDVDERTVLAPDRDASEDTVVANLDDTPTVIDARRLLDDDPNAWTLVSPHPGPGRGHTEPQARNTPSVDIRTPVSPGNPGNPNDPRSSRTDSLASNVRSRRANRRSGSAALTRIALPQGVAPTREVVEPDDAVVRYAARHIAATPTGPTLTFAELPPEAHRAPATAIPSVARRGRRFGRLALTAFGAACIVSVVGIILLIVTLTA